MPPSRLQISIANVSLKPWADKISPSLGRIELEFWPAPSGSSSSLARLGNLQAWIRHFPSRATVASASSQEILAGMATGIELRRVTLAVSDDFPVQYRIWIASGK
jgi:hypothetical protein